MELEIKGVKYRTAKLSVFDQLKVTRKLLPVLAGMMSDFGSIRSRLPADGKIGTVKFEQLNRCLKPCSRVSLRNCLP